MKKLAILLIGLLITTLIAGAVGCGGGEAGPTPGGGADPTPAVKPITLKLVSSTPAESTGGQVNVRFAELVEEYTGGRVEIDIFPGSQLFPATEQWEAVTTGAVDLMADTTYYLRGVVPDVLAFYLEGLFINYEHLYSVLEDSEVPRILADKFEEAGPVKLLGLAPTSMGGCVINSVKETQSLADLKGLKTQSSPGAPPLPLYEYTGMVAVPVAFEELTAAFIQGVINGVQVPPDTITSLRLYETGKHALCRPAWGITTAILTNEKSWERLPADIQDIILNQVMPEAYEYQKNSYREAEQVALDVLEEELETLHYVSQEDMDAYLEYVPTHPTIKVQTLMIEPEIMEIIGEMKPTR